MKRFTITVLACFAILYANAQIKNTYKELWNKYWQQDADEFIIEPWKSFFSYSEFDATIKSKDLLESNTTALSIINYDNVQFGIQMYFMNELTDGYNISAYIQNANAIVKKGKQDYVYVCLLYKGEETFKGVIISTDDLKQLSRGITSNNVCISIEDINKRYSYIYRNLKD